MKRVIVFGNVSLDIVLFVDRLPAPGETLLANDMMRCPGGKGLNQAIAAYRAGARVKLLASLGRDPDGAFLRSAVEAEGGIEAGWRFSDAPTDVSTIRVSASGENEIVSSAGSAREMGVADSETLLSDLGSDDILLLQGNLPRGTTYAAIRAAKAREAFVIINTAPVDPGMGDVLSLADIVVANEVEASILTGLERDAAALALLKRGCGTAVVTLGAEGLVFADRGCRGTKRIEAPATEAVDSSGAGDVFVGTLAAELARPDPRLDAALSFAAAAASLSVRRRGTVPSFPTAAELNLLRARHRSEVEGSFR
jgi:ribokinase